MSEHRFDLAWEPLYADRPDAERVATIPWDTETFGFGVAELATPEEWKETPDADRLSERLREWSHERGIELVSCGISPERYAVLRLLRQAGFVYTDTTLGVQYDNVRRSTYAGPKMHLRDVATTEEGAVEEIAAVSFRWGRYHADSRFPSELADKRYRDWVRRAFDTSSSQRVLVAILDGDVIGFSVVEATPPRGHFHLVAVSPSEQGSPVGMGMLASTMRYFKQLGIRRVHSKISAANTRALNLHARLGASFHDPLVCMHWHAPDATHLLE